MAQLVELGLSGKNWRALKNKKIKKNGAMRGSERAPVGKLYKRLCNPGIPSDWSILTDFVNTRALSPCQTIATRQHNISQHTVSWVQHVACVWPPCCDMLDVVGSNLTSFKLEPTTSNMLQHIATWWPNARNMLHPTMLRYVGLTCCDRLAGALLMQMRYAIWRQSEIRPFNE